MSDTKPPLRLAGVIRESIVDGPGIRTTVFAQGCPHRCEGCHNPQTWDPESGIVFDKEAEKELFEILGRDYISGITFSGGDPLFEGNRMGIERLARKVKLEYPDKNIWLYTGYRWEEISALPMMQFIDVLVDGRFMEDLKDTKLHWKGSFNQRIIDVQKSLKNSSLYLYNAE